MTLYGFPTRDERDTFEVLIGASGVGPKLGARDPVGARAGRAAPVPAEDDLDSLVPRPRASASAPRRS